jgi:nitrogen fixation/metabolism regulation signal transduction histidine kinase
VIDFTMQVDPETLEITADQALKEKVLINICKNSEEAVNGISNPKAELTAGSDGLGNLVVKVIDTGRELADMWLKKSLSPFSPPNPIGPVPI